MNFFDKLYLIRKRILNGRNGIFLLVTVLLCSLLLFCLSVYIIMDDYINDSILKSDKARSLHVTVSTDDFSKIDNIDHVVVNVPYKNTSYLSNSDESHRQYIKIIPLLEEVKIINGREIRNDNELICPDNFYPRSVYDEVDEDLFIKGTDVLERKYIVTNLNNLEEKKEFVVVGTYDNFKNFQEMNVCYMRRSVYELMQVDRWVTMSAYDADGNLIDEEYDSFKGNLVRVDNVLNKEEVKNKLIDLGYNVVEMEKTDVNQLKLYMNVPLFVGIIIVIVAINVFISYIKKKVFYQQKRIGLLKALGYSKKEIINLEVMENLLIVVGALLIVSGLYLGIFSYLQKKFFVLLLLEGFIVKIPIGVISIYYLLVLLGFGLLTKIIVNRLLNKEEIRILRGD